MNHHTPFPPTAHDAALEAAAVRESEEYLAGFRDGWNDLSSQARPVALSQALWSLTILALSNGLQMEIVIGDVARAAGLPKMELRKQIEDRATFFRRLPELYKHHRQQTEVALCRLILD
jgi:hypothetical protein